MSPAGEIGARLRERVVKALLEAGLHLQELREEGPRLEEVFSRLTDDHQPPPTDETRS